MKKQYAKTNLINAVKISYADDQVKMYKNDGAVDVI